MRFIPAFAALLSAGILAAPATQASGDTPHWGYAGHEAPDHWAGLDAIYSACAGEQQSPVDLAAGRSAAAETIDRNWHPFSPLVLNNGHTIQANAPAGNVTIVDGKAYELLQVHFHHQSEHTIDGKHSPLEAHFVHKAADGALLVLGVMIEEGPASAEIQTIWEVVPAANAKAQAKAEADLAKMIPAGTHFRYAGSLTTPPCSEIVNWVVFTQPITASKQQIQAFADLYPVNNRPVQALNRRFILVSE